MALVPPAKGASTPSRRPSPPTKTPRAKPGGRLLMVLAIVAVVVLGVVTRVSPLGADDPAVVSALLIVLTLARAATMGGPRKGQAGFVYDEEEASAWSRSSVDRDRGWTEEAVTREKAERAPCRGCGRVGPENDPVRRARGGWLANRRPGAGGEPRTEVTRRGGVDRTVVFATLAFSGRWGRPTGSGPAA